MALNRRSGELAEDFVAERSRHLLVVTKGGSGDVDVNSGTGTDISVAVLSSTLGGLRVALPARLDLLAVVSHALFVGHLLDGFGGQRRR